jgi:hypothetical protein
VATDYYSRKKVHIIFFKKRFANADSMPIKLVYPVHFDHPPVACWTASMMTTACTSRTEWRTPFLHKQGPDLTGRHGYLAWLRRLDWHWVGI